MNKNNEIDIGSEVERTVEHAWLFDVDGVITNPQEKKNTEPEIIEQIIRSLELGEPVALVTGRSTAWLKERVLAPILQKMVDKSKLPNLFVLAEKGGCSITFDEKGQPHETIDESLKVSQPLKREIEEVIKGQFASNMFVDQSKRTMITIEMEDRIELDDFKRDQGRFVKVLPSLLAKYNLYTQLRVDPTTIATDIEDKKVGKAYASSRVLGWLKERNVQPQGFVVVGDSQSDLDMAKEIDRNNFPVKFIYVGEPQRLRTEDISFPVVTTKSRFEKGTLEYLRGAN